MQKGGESHPAVQLSNCNDDHLMENWDLGCEDEHCAANLLASRNRSVESLPADMAAGIKLGLVHREVLLQYLHWERTFLIGTLMRFAGFRERVLGDPGFPMKVSVEAGMGVITKLLAEQHKRPTKFLLELDLVFANVIMSLLADVMLIWIPAPRLGFSAQTQHCKDRHMTQANIVTQWLSECPDNAFQVVPAGKRQWTYAQRGAAFIKASVLLFIVGFVSSIFGVCIINILVAARSLLNTETEGIEISQGALYISMLHGVYMASSGNIRYQILAGIIEERGMNRLFAQNPKMLSMVCFVVRTINTYYGSAHWVTFIRFFGLQGE